VASASITLPSSTGSIAILVAASRTSTYTPTAAFANLVYNAAPINVGSAYNTTTGVFTAPATGIYQIIIANKYSTTGLSSNTLSARIVVNSAVDMETSASMSPFPGSSLNTSIYANTIVQMTSGQTANIMVGDLVNAMTPQVGAGEHTLKIILLN